MIVAVDSGSHINAAHEPCASARRLHAHVSWHFRHLSATEPSRALSAIALRRAALSFLAQPSDSLRVPMMDEDSGDPSVGVEFHDLELESAHVAPKIDGHRINAGKGIE